MHIGRSFEYALCFLVRLLIRQTMARQSSLVVRSPITTFPSSSDELQIPLCRQRFQTNHLGRNTAKHTFHVQEIVGFSIGSPNLENSEKTIRASLHRSYVRNMKKLSKLQSLTPSATLISSLWKKEPEEEKLIWQERAQEEDRLHKQKYPGYKYTTKKHVEKNK